MKLLDEELKAINQAEQVLTQALYSIIGSVESLEFLQAIEKNLRETEGHIEKVEQAFELLAEKVINRILADFEPVKKPLPKNKQTPDTTKFDEGWNDSFSYKTLRVFSKILGLHEIVDFLEEISDKKQPELHSKSFPDQCLRYAPESSLLKQAYFLN